MVLTKNCLVPFGLVAAVAVAGWVHVSRVLTIRSEEITTESGGVTLSGLLATPRFGDLPFPTVVVAHGSGETTRDALRGFVAKLVPEGFAVLIHDKRGTGKSGGELPATGFRSAEVGLARLASDLRAWIATARDHPAVDAERMGLLGGSQAGWVMPLVANAEPDLRFMAVISGPAVTLAEEDLYSKLTGDDPGSFEPGELTDEEIRERLAELDGPAWYDPTPALEQLNVPSLWMMGGLDRSVPTELCAERLAALPASVRDQLTVVWYPEADHSLRRPDGARIDFWGDLLGWLHEHAARRE